MTRVSIGAVREEAQSSMGHREGDRVLGKTSKGNVGADS